MPKTSPPTPSVDSAAPVTSKRPERDGIAGRNRGAGTIMVIPIGTLTKNPARHEIAAIVEGEGGTGHPVEPAQPRLRGPLMVGS